MYGIQVEPGKPGAEVSKKKTIGQRKNLPIECAHGDQPLRCPNWVFEWTSLQPFHGGDVVTCFDVVGCRVRWSNVVGCGVTWGEVMWLVARCHVMWCDVVSCHLMWCDLLCSVTSRDALWCHVMCSHVMSVICCEVMRCHEFVMRCGWLQCHVVKGLCDVVSCKMSRWSVLQRTASTTQYYKVLQSTTPYSKILQSTTTQYYSGTTPVPQSTTPVLVCTTKYYYDTTKYYSGTTPVPQNPVPQNTTPVLQSTTQYYEVLLRTTKHYKVLRRLIVQHMKRPVQCAKQQESPSDFTKYCACHKMILMIDLCPRWNVQYNARSNRCDPPTSPNSVSATKNDAHDWSSSNMKGHLQCAEKQDSSSNVTKYCTCHTKWLSWMMSVTYETSYTISGATGVIHQHHQVLRLPNKMALQNLREICRKQLKRHLQWRTIREWSNHDPSMKLQNWTRPFAEVPFRASETHFVL